MFYYISGTLAHKGDNFAVIDAAGVGYKIYTSLYSLETLGELGSEAKLFTYLYVREDIFDLYGFATQEEMRLFELLLSVSGVGPKAALSLLSVMPPQKLVLAIVTGDAAAIKKAQGVGPKAAQRVILELKDKMAGSDMVTDSSLAEFAAAPAGASNEAVEALCVLGYSAAEAKSALAGVNMEQDLELIIKGALKKLVR